MRNFGGIEDKYSSLESSHVLLQSIPYDGTSTWGKGADKGFDTFLEAAENMELFDIETGLEVYKKGIHILPKIDIKSSPEAVYEGVRASTEKILNLDKFPTFFGGEHSVSIGIIEAFQKKYDNLSVLQLDAHADLRESYMGSKFNHACAVHQASKTTNLVQVGIRSMDSSEKPYLNPEKCFFAEKMYGQNEWMPESIDLLTDPVYITLDLDVLDPSIMPATGTPEPGGMDWNTIIQYLKKVFESREVVGFDIVEFAPIEGFNAPSFLVSKLYYKLLSYKFNFDGE